MYLAGGNPDCARIENVGVPDTEPRCTVYQKKNAGCDSMPTTDHSTGGGCDDDTMADTHVTGNPCHTSSQSSSARTLGGQTNELRNLHRC